MVLLEPLLPTITTIQTQLLQAPHVRWLIGGSCGLLLQHVDIGRSPRDLDLYVDYQDVTAAHSCLQPYSVDVPMYNETPIYASILSHYIIDDNAVELVGDFKVKAMQSAYQVEASYLWEAHSQTVQITGHHVRLMPLAHELLFNLLRNRPDRYEAIRHTMLANPGLHMPVLNDLLQRNSWGTEFQHRLEQLMKDSLR
ncbi:hypothetical protein HQN90_02065 [Paenibacillus alba]|uniref:hypothetical protein n=1 Tax=Paenibacillus alba TaxID=1197127 RepID=UPI001565F261|nr:hypothetical protein [Paenibacillus alba]NQX64902.1 hypothetical protein [Paenibacillus alba]